MLKQKINLGDFYLDYKSRETKNDVVVNEAAYRDVCKFLVDNIIDTLVEGKFVTLPFNLGILKIVKFKTKRKYIDWKSTNELGKHVYFTNFHTGGWSYKLKWDKRQVKRFYSDLIYKFKLTQANSRNRIAKGLKENKLEFLSE